MSRICSFLLLTGLSFAQLGQVRAQGEEPVEDLDTIALSTFGHSYPVRFARRPLVLHEGMVRADSRLTIAGATGSGTFSALDIGGAVSPVKNLELGLSTQLTGAIPAPGGISLISVIFSPKASYGDIPVYARYQFHEGKSFLAGVDLAFVLPANSDFSITAGLPMRVIELFNLFTMDMNLNIRYRNGDKFAAYVTDPSNATFDFTFSGASITNITDHGYIEIGGGIGVVNVGGAAGANNVLELPAYLGGGYTYKGDVLIDIFAQFGWQPVMTVNGPPGVDLFNIADDWFSTVGVKVHTRELFGPNKR